MAIYLIVLLCILNHAAFTGSRVVFSLYALDLGASSFAIGVLVSFYALCPLLLAIYAGKLIDRVGARRPMLLGTLGLVGGIGLPVAVHGLPVLYFAALLLGSSFMFFFVAVQGVTGAVGGPQDRGRNYSLLSVSRDTPKNAAISCWALYYIIQGIILKVLHILLFLWDKRAQHNATD